MPSGRRARLGRPGAQRTTTWRSSSPRFASFAMARARPATPAGTQIARRMHSDKPAAGQELTSLPTKASAIVRATSVHHRAESLLLFTLCFLHAALSSCCACCACRVFFMPRFFHAAPASCCACRALFMPHLVHATHAAPFMPRLVHAAPFRCRAFFMLRQFMPRHLHAAPYSCSSSSYGACFMPRLLHAAPANDTESKL